MTFWQFAEAHPFAVLIALVVAALMVEHTIRSAVTEVCLTIRETWKVKE